MPSWIGDLALALSVVDRKAKMPDTTVTLLVPEKLVTFCKLLANHPVIPYRRKTFADYRATLGEIRSHHFDAFYVLPHSFSSAWFSFVSGIKKRRGVCRECREFLFTQALPRSLRTNTRHITYEYSQVLETGYEEPETWVGVSIDKFDTYKNSIVLCPGSMYGPAKRWNGFANLATLLPNDNIVLLGDSKDTPAAQAIINASPKNVTDLTGKTSLIDACKIIAGAKAVVANDSGLMHCAGYLGTPVVGIFGSTSPTWTRPLGALSKTASVNTGCPPCFDRTCKHNHYACLEKVSPRFVAEILEGFISPRL
jgi:heptosyltransferase-2